MPRFFKEFFENAPFIDGADAHHIEKSLRMRVGEEITVCDTKGTDFLCRISGFLDGKVLLEILKTQKNTTEPSVEVTLYQCLPKGDKMDTVVKQSVELGVQSIVPVLSTNCVSRPDQKAALKKCERWQKIANEAAGQSGRGILPQVSELINLKDIAKYIQKDEVCYFCYELGGEPFRAVPKNVKKISVIIGSEGGFTADEAEFLTENGFIKTTLGPRILRTETAPIAALSAIMLQSGNME